MLISQTCIGLLCLWLNCWTLGDWGTMHLLINLSAYKLDVLKSTEQLFWGRLSNLDMWTTCVPACNKIYPHTGELSWHWPLGVALYMLRHMLSLTLFIARCGRQRAIRSIVWKLFHIATSMNRCLHISYTYSHTIAIRHCCHVLISWTTYAKVAEFMNGNHWPTQSTACGDSLYQAARVL